MVYFSLLTLSINILLIAEVELLRILVGDFTVLQRLKEDNKEFVFFYHYH